MARLRNRIVKADYWGDGDLLRMPRDKRDTYRGLWAVAEDSGCIEDDPFTWKLLLWPGPLDSDITVEMIEQWRDELVKEGKLIPYQVGRRSLFFIEPFHRHEHPRNPQINDLPLPQWVTWVPSMSDHRKGKYDVSWEAMAAYIESRNASYNDCTTIVQGLTPARPALPCSALTPLPPASNPEVEKLLVLAAKVRTAKASWNPKQTDMLMFGTLLERFPAVQLRTELQKFTAYALNRDWVKVGRAFVNWMNRVEPQAIPGSHIPFGTEYDVPPPTETERFASAEIIRAARRQARADAAGGGQA